MRDDGTRPECFCQIWYINRPKALRSKTARTVRCWFFEVSLAPSAFFHSRYITSISCLWCCFCLHCSLLDWMNWSSAHRTWSLNQIWCYITKNNDSEHKSNHLLTTTAFVWNRTSSRCERSTVKNTGPTCRGSLYCLWTLRGRWSQTQHETDQSGKYSKDETRW